MKLNSNALLSSRHEAKPRWRSPDTKKLEKVGKENKEEKESSRSKSEWLIYQAVTPHNTNYNYLQGRLHSMVSQNFHHILHFKVRQLMASVTFAERKNRIWLFSYVYFCFSKLSGFLLMQNTSL